MGDDRNLGFELERFKPQSTKRRFATLEEDDDKFDSRIQVFHKGFFDRPDGGFATQKAVKICNPCLLINQVEEVINKKTYERKMTKRITSNHGSLVDDESTVRLKRFITGEMLGLDMKLVIQKTLYESDMQKSLSRLNMPIKQLVTHPDEFLTVDEKQRTVDERCKDGVEVRVVGPTLQMYKQPLWLKMWHMKQTDNYVLKKNWNNFVAENEEVLKKDTMIQVWSFRKNRQLCFAIIPVKKADEDIVN